MNGSNKLRLRGYLHNYLVGPLLLTVLLVILNIPMYVVDANAGFLMSCGVFLYITIAASYYYTKKNAVLNELVTFAAQYGQVQKQLIMDLEFPYAVLDEAGNFMWFNKGFANVINKDSHRYHKSITTIFPDLVPGRFPKEVGEEDYYFRYGERDFRVHVKSIEIDSLLDNADVLERVDEESHIFMYAVYLFEETELNYFIRKSEDEMMVSAVIYLDNYDEALESVEEVRRSLMIALIDRKITKYFNDLDCVVKKYEKDKYFLTMTAKSLEELKNLRFSILEEVKTVNIGNDMSMTISMGIGANSGSCVKDAEHARIAIDLALGRGGDQVVLRDGDSISYFGGKSLAMEKSTRVKARVKAHALKEFMDSKDKVMVMGHQLTDVDSLGAAIGIYRAARTLDKKAHIVVDKPSTSIAPLMEGFRNNSDYPSDMFLNCQEAISHMDKDTMLVVVDTNRPSYTECPELLDMAETIVVLDHHRQSDEVIHNTVLSYIEPYASSASEMVAEILQYFAEGPVIKNIEADAIYAGIMIDTDNFVQKTGVRTFEAAAYLRSCGADVTRVRKLFREELPVYKARGQAIADAEVFRDNYVISVCPADHLVSPTIVGAQAANELLNVLGVKASFILTDYQGKIFISARAIDEVNVQLVMERMGGGGHMNIAGCQLPGYTIEKAKEYLITVLGEMLDGGEI
ncbi:MAG: DHH family phosphoesterase [Lachnospiraceae bacterium]|nr:DHH family phosphoesterase [Lachnospiraceae bacterium]